MRAAILSICLLLAAAGCSTTGRPIDEDSVTKIQPYRSTQQDVRLWFGEPQSVRYNSHGRSSWRYLHEEHKRRDTGTITKIGRSIASIFGGRTYLPPVDLAYEEHTTHRLVVVFDSNGTVLDYAYERDTTPTKKIY
jgi:outer membrane protein assembly factor BamE (lipoprotein component of BamABCDE complex)